jgi:tetratricopeptide (TPR) repeat protein
MKAKAPDQPATIGCMNNLAACYNSAGRTQEALKLREEALPLMKAKLGPDHRVTIGCMIALAESYAAAGRIQEALKLHEEALEVKKAKLGPDHPDTLGSTVNLAHRYFQLRRPRDAIQLYEQVLPVMKANMPDHEFTFNCMSGLAVVYAAVGRTEEALKIHEEALQLCKAKLGHDHHATLAGMVNLAIDYRDVGRLTDAIKLLEEALPLMKAKMPDHEFTFNCMTSLGSAYAEAGRFPEAIKLCEETLRLQKAKRGPDHPRTLAALDRLSFAYLAVAAQQAWFGQEQEWAATCERALSLAQDTKVATVADKVAKLCSLRQASDKTQQAALVLARRAVEMGKGNRNLNWFQMGLGVAEYRDGHFAEADAALTAAMEAGKDNAYIARTSAFYRAMSLFRQGKQDEARQVATQAAANMKPLPKDDKNPLAGGANADDLILWLAYKEAKELIKFDEKRE